MKQDLVSLYHDIEARLDALDFGALWQGFTRSDFALYTDERACLNGALTDKDARFFGNAAIKRDGGRIAIWHIERGCAVCDDEAKDALAANIVHEMFHAYQYQYERANGRRTRVFRLDARAHAPRLGGARAGVLP